MFSARDNWYIRVDVSNFRRLPIDEKKRETTAFRYFRCHRRGKRRRASGNDRLGRTVLRRNNVLRPLPRKIKSENLITAATGICKGRESKRARKQLFVECKIIFLISWIWCPVLRDIWISCYENTMKRRKKRWNTRFRGRTSPLLVDFVSATILEIEILCTIEAGLHAGWAVSI